jgi:hypothetical protein
MESSGANPSNKLDLIIFFPQYCIVQNHMKSNLKVFFYKYMYMFILSFYMHVHIMVSSSYKNTHNYFMLRLISRI